MRLILGFLVLLTACTTATEDQSNISGLVNASVENKIALCEVMYAAHPHKKAVVAIGRDRLNQTYSFNFDEMTAFSKAFISTTQTIAERAAFQSDNNLNILEQELVLGGYEGETIPSVVIRVAVEGETGYQALLRMAAHIGYVYAQDSTLVICADKPVQGWQPATALEVSDSGQEVFFKETNVPLFFGMIIGAFNGPDSLGYTFYKDSKVFSILVASDYEQGEASVIEGLADWLNDISNGDIELDISSRSVWIFFPHNDWMTAPNGEDYQRYMADGKADATLRQSRKQYLRDVDKFLSQRTKQ